MRGEDGPILLPQTGCCQLFVARDLKNGRFEGRLKANQLGVDGIGPNKSLWNTEVFGSQHQGRADGDSGRYGDSASDFHQFSATSPLQAN
jgi:hypothetical protein